MPRRPAASLKLRDEAKSLTRLCRSGSGLAFGMPMFTRADGTDSHPKAQQNKTQLQRCFLRFEFGRARGFWLRLPPIGLNRPAPRTRSITAQPRYMDGQYRRSSGVNANFHNIFREGVERQWLIFKQVR